MPDIIGQYTDQGWKELTKQFGGEDFDVKTGIFKAKRCFLGPWDQRYNFILTNLIPRAEVVAGRLVYFPGAVYPDFPTARVTSIRIQGRGISAQEGNFRQISFERAEIEVNYDTSFINETGNPESPEDLQIYSESFSGGVDVLEIPGEAIVDPNDNAIPEIGKFAKRIPTTTYTLTSHFVLAPNFSLYEDKLGKINNVSFAAPSVTKGPKEVLFDSYSANRAIMLSGARTWEVSKTFIFRTIEWDKMYNKDGELVRVTRRGGGKLFDEGDIHRVLFA